MSRLVRSVDWYVSWMNVGHDENTKAAAFRKRREEADQRLRDIQGGHFEADTFEALIQLLDHECYCLAPLSNSQSLRRRNSGAMEKSWTSILITGLSGCLFQTIYPESYYERELQFRALFSALVLQRLQEAEARQVGHYENLQQQFQKCHKDLHWQRSWSGELTKEKFRKYQCSFLLVANAEYSKILKQEEPVIITIISRTIKLITAGVSLALASTTGLGSESLQSIIETLNESFKPLTETPGKNSDDVFMLQEITRITLASKLHAKAFEDSVDAYRRDRSVMSSLRPLVEWIMERILFFLDKEKLEERVSHPAPTWNRIRGVFDLGPGSFNDYYYMYGLLDCATQLARILEEEMVPVRFREKMWQVIRNSKDSSLRWKAIEFLALADMRKLSTDLRKNVNDPLLLREVDVIRACLNEEADPQSLSRLTSLSMVTSVSEDSLGSLQDMNHREWIEPMEHYPFFHIPTELEYSFIPFGRKLSNKYYSTGLSQDCSSVFFLGEKNIVVYSLEQFPQFQEASIRLRVMPSTNGEFKAVKAVLTRSFLAIIIRGKPNNQLSVYRHGIPSSNEDQLNSEIFYGWFPTCVAMHESKEQAWIAVGGHSNQTGSVRIYCIEEARGKYSFKRHNAQFEKFVQNAFCDDWPKFLEFSRDCGRLTALTSKKNKVLVWFLSDNVRPRQAAFEIMKRYEGGMARGLESVSLFHAPSTRPYVLCTTSPSERREENGGEWPFISPVHTGPCTVPKQLEHSFSNLHESKPIIAGAVSAQGNLVAMLENTGNVILSVLSPSEDGGLCPSGRILVLRKILAAPKNSVTTTTCIRFNEHKDGKRFSLFAVDVKGKVIRKTFPTINCG